MALADERAPPGGREARAEAVARAAGGAAAACRSAAQRAERAGGDEREQGVVALKPRQRVGEQQRPSR